MKRYIKELEELGYILDRDMSMYNYAHFVNGTFHFAIDFDKMKIRVAETDPDAICFLTSDLLAIIYNMFEYHVKHGAWRGAINFERL